jgi:hypothetical protein
VAAEVVGGEAGVLLEGVGLGRHWFEIRAGAAAQRLEATLPFHPYILVTFPPNRAPVPHSPEPWRVCFHLVAAADCSEDGPAPGEDFGPACAPAAPAAVTVDGVRRATAPSVGAPPALRAPRVAPRPPARPRSPAARAAVPAPAR